MVAVEEDAGVVQDEQALDVAAAPQVGGEAGAVLPGEVTQEAESSRQSPQEPEGHLAEGRTQRLWRRTAQKQRNYQKRADFYICADPEVFLSHPAPAGGVLSAS